MPKSMGKRLILIAAVFAGLTLLMLGVLAFALPQWVETEAFQAGLRSRASAALGTDVAWDHAEIGLLPPRVILDSLELRGEASAGEGSEGSEETRLRAESVDLRISLWPLLSRRVEMGSLVFRGVDLVVTQTDAGWILPIEVGATKDEGEGANRAAPPPESLEAEEVAAGAVALTLGQVRLTETRILIRDRALERKIDWQLSDLSFEAKEQAESGRYAMQFESDLAAGSKNMGRLEGKGGISLGVEGAGDFALEIDLAGMRLEELVSYLPVSSAAGLLSGRLAISGQSTQIAEIGADLLAEELVTRVAGIDLDGSLTIKGVQRPGAPSDFEVGIDPAAGGRVDIQGSLAPGGALEATAQLKQVDSIALMSMLGDRGSISGPIDGEISLARRADGSFSGFQVDLEIGTFGYADATYRLNEGDLKVDLAFQGERAGSQPTVYALRSTLGDARVQQAESGPRRIEGRLGAKLSLEQADVAELPFGFAIEALPSGFLTGVVTARGALQSGFPAAEGGQARTPLDLKGEFKLDADMGATGPIALDTRMAFEEGGVVEAKGETTREGVLDLKTRIETFDLKRLRPFLGDGEFSVGGTLSGTGRLLGPAASPSRLVLDAQITGGEMISGEYQVTGPFGIALAVTSPLSAARKGSANLDLTKAKLLYEGRFEKKAGIPAQLDTDFAPNAAGKLEFESRLKLKNLEKIQIRGALGEDRAMTLSATSLDLGEAAEFVPALAEYRATGRVTLSDFSVQQPASGGAIFAGRLALADVAVILPEAGRVGLVGAVVGDGNRLRTEALQLVANAVKLELEGHLEDPLGEGRFSFSGRTVGTPEVNDLLSALTSKRDAVFGPLQLSGDFSGALSQTKTIAESLVGTLKFSVGEDVGGILRGVSLLKVVLDQMPILGSAVWSKPFRGGRSVEDFFTDKFEVMQGEFAIQQGSVEAKTLRLVYQGYEANLSGRMQLGDLSLDMTGELLLQSDLIAVLVGALGGDGTDRKPIQIPLARVSNTLSAPKVSMTPRTLAAIPKILIQATGLDRLKDGLEEGLGKILDPIRPRIGGNP